MDTGLVVLVTFIGAFLSFILSEWIFHASGIYAVLAIGIMLNKHIKSCLSHEAEHAMHTVWTMVVFS